MKLEGSPKGLFGSAMTVPGEQRQAVGWKIAGGQTLFLVGYSFDVESVTAGVVKVSSSPCECWESFDGREEDASGAQGGRKSQ
jgi:hypothetical protein